jgi:lysophospholipase L1-like esterase
MKKIMISFLVGILSIGMTACGNTTVKEDVKEDVTDYFASSVFMGDSITEGFAFNEILPEESVIAGAGTTAGFIYDDVDALVEKKPDNVFIMLGSIDVLMPVDDPKALFRTDLTKLVNRIKEELPECKIYLQSVLPVTEETIKAEPRYEELEEYDEIVKEVAEQLSVKYVDLKPLVEETPDLYAEDGIHFKKEIYQLWLEKLAEL